MSKKILIIEDDEDSRLLLEELLSSEDCEINLAENAQEAESIIEKQSLDIILTDLRIPGVTEKNHIINFVRRNNPESNARIVIVSGDSEIKETARELGVEYIKKPFNIEQILNLIQ